MRTAGSASWRLDVFDSELAATALFVRDAVGLVVPSAAEVPPALDSPVVDRRGVLSDRDRADATVQWVPWWQRVLDVEFELKRAGVLPPAGRRTSDAAAAVRTVSDPPEFGALAQVPQLQAAVRATFDDAARWRRRRAFRPEAARGGEMVNRAVDDVAFDRHVPVHSLSGAVMVLPVAGPWWRRIARGEALCSGAAASHPGTFYQVVYEVFASSPGGSPGPPAG